MQRITKLNRLTLCPDGSVEVQFMKCILDGDTLLNSEPHRTVMSPDETAEDMLSRVNPHLEEMGFSTITDEEIQQIDKLLTMHREFPAVASGVAAYKQEKADMIAAAEAAETERVRLATEAEAEAVKQAEIEAAAEAARQDKVAKQAIIDAAIQKKIADDHIKQLVAEGIAAAQKGK